MKVLILAAGYGTRLEVIAKDIPKPLLSIKDRPLIDYIADKFRNLSGISQILVVTNNKFFHAFESWAEKQKDFSQKPKVINDGSKSPDERLGSMGDINFVIQKEKISEDLLVVGGDNLFDAGLEDFIRRAKENSPHVTIGLYDIKEKEKAKIFGVVGLDEKGKVISFEEKPSQPKSTLIGMCLYYYPKESLGLVDRYLKESKKSDTAGDYINWLYQKESVYGFKFSGKWYDIGSVESYYEASGNFK